MSNPRRVLAILGPTATGKSALALAIAERHGGEIVSCDSTAVYCAFDIGTDKTRPAERRGIPHHLIDVVEPTEIYSAARYAQDAAAAVHAISTRGRLPIIVGGTGLYYRALTRGLFPGPARNVEIRARLESIAVRRGVEFLHRMVSRVDPASGARILPRDLKRLVRALEVYFLTGKSLSDHFDETVAPLKGCEIAAIALHLRADQTAERVARRVDDQFARGLLEEVRGLLAHGVPESALPFGGLVYRQVLEYLHGLRNEADTRALIVRENRRYARRQLIWFRKEPNLIWLQGPGERIETIETVEMMLRPHG